MSHEAMLGREFFEKLWRYDCAIAAATQRSRCSRCGGPLSVGRYERKPRGGRLASAGEELTLRHSFCCSRDGCRGRATPPSLRFLGRKVYLESAILLACVVVPLLEQTARAIREATGIAARTVCRWQSWWRTLFIASSVFTEVRGRVGPLDEHDLPGSLLDALVAETVAGKLEQCAHLLAPLTTTSASSERT